MPWYGYSLIALVGNSLYAICIKWALNLKISREKLLLYVFTGYTIGYFLLDMRNLGSVIATGRIWLLLLMGALVATISILANFQSVKSTQFAPNPGYTESVKSANALVTTFFAWLIFSAAVPAKTWIGIAIVPLGLFFLLNTKKERKQGNWRLPAVLGALLFSGMFIVYKYMGILNFTPLEIILSLSFFAAIGFLIVNLFKKGQDWKYPLKLWLPIVLAIIVGIFANWMNLIAISKVANPGLPQAIFNTQAIFTLGLARFVFPVDKGGEWNAKKWLGVIVTIVGVIIIALTK